MNDDQEHLYVSIYKAYCNFYGDNFPGLNPKVHDGFICHIVIDDTNHPCKVMTGGDVIYMGESRSVKLEFMSCEVMGNMKNKYASLCVANKAFAKVLLEGAEEIDLELFIKPDANT